LRRLTAYKAIFPYNPTGSVSPRHLWLTVKRLFDRFTEAEAGALKE
jgi:hypothetical protein